MLRVAGEDENIPLELERRRIAAGLTPANDVPEYVVRPWVRSAQSWHLRRPAVRIVRERAIDLPRSRVHRDPFGTIHPGRAHCIGCSPRADQYVRLIGECTGCGKPAVTVRQRSPFTASI